MDSSAPNVRRQAGEVFHGLGNEENARLDEQNLFAEKGCVMGVSDGSVGFGTATWPVDIEIGGHIEYSSKNKEPARAGGHLAGSLECILVRLGP
jgi:hypothetical protein